jgi:hypothetical protein
MYLRKQSTWNTQQYYSFPNITFCYIFFFGILIIRPSFQSDGNFSSFHISDNNGSTGQSSWLQIQRSRVRFPEIPDFLRSSGFGTGSTQLREDSRGAT